jgi:hypothetical protein
MLADQMVQALDSRFTMAAESSIGISALKRNRTVVAAFWVLGVIAVVEVVLAAIAAQAAHGHRAFASHCR